MLAVLAQKNALLVHGCSSSPADCKRTRWSHTSCSGRITRVSPEFEQGKVALPGVLLDLELVPAVGQIMQGALAVSRHPAEEDPDRSAQYGLCSLDHARKITQQQMVNHDLAIGEMDERLPMSVSHGCRLLVGVLLCVHAVCLSSHDYKLDTCRVCWQGGATYPQAANLDVDSSEMPGFLLL